MSTPSPGPRNAGNPKGRSQPLRGFIRVDPAAPPPRRETFSKRLISSLSASTALHLAILLVLGLIYFEMPRRQFIESMLLFTGTEEGNSVQEIELGGATEQPVNLGDDQESNAPLISDDDLAVMLPVVADLDLPPEFNRGQGEQVAIATTKGSGPKANSGAPTTKANSGSKKGANKDNAGNGEGEGHADHFIGRKGSAKAALLKRMGGTDASEAAVARGLVWLRNHQFPDGSWNFNHLYLPRCDCTQPGRLDSNTNAATALALLAFLGAGQTHEEGDYQPEVQQAIDYLLTHGLPVNKGICFYGNLTGQQTFYTHGLVTIALSEALAMTGDPKLRPAVTGAVEFLAATQESGGGWRYYPGQPGDTSVVAWQLMGLKSAQFSRVTVPQKVFHGIDRFMRSVSAMRGSEYAYTPDRKLSPTPSMTAAGLLCRMYLEWKDNGGMQAGIRFLDEHGPEPDGMYYNYYATQVMHHWGGPEWDRWNVVMREHLIQTQIQGGHAAGSWDIADRHGNVGGRLYMTTLALLTLEVYYRHLPLYQKNRIEIPLIKEPAEPARR